MPALEPFDPLRPLVANTFFRLHGKLYRKNDAVPYAEGDDRVLRRQYELRRIGHGKGAVSETSTEAEKAAAASAATRQQAKGKKIAPTDTQLAAPTPEQQAAADQLAKDNTKAQLLELGEGLDGLTDKQTKGEIALALVRAGRGAA